MPATATQRHLAEHFDPKVLAALEGLDLKSRYVMEGFLQGVHDSPFHGFSVEFSDYREYQPGDDLKFVDWRLYARTDRLHIKRFMQETNARFYLLCDLSASMGYRGAAAWGSKFEAARILAAAMTWFLLRQNDAAGLIALEPEGTRYLRPSQSSAQFGTVLRQLEQLEPAGGDCLGRLIAETVRLTHRRGIILLFSDLLEPSDAVREGFQQLRFHGHEVLVIQVLDRDETEFRFADGAVFEDLETGARRQVSPAAVREKYLARFNEFMAGHRDFFRGAGIPHCVVHTDESPWPALAMFLHERKKLG